MKTHGILLFVLVGIAASSNISSQDKPVFDVTQLAENIYELSTDGGGYTVKVIASVGEDGILLVDTGQKETGSDLLATLQTLGSGPPKIVINTHSHIEHTGGNIALGKGPVVIGHRNLRARLRSGSFLFDEFPDESIPQVTFTDSLRLHFNGEDIELLAFPGAHDDSDIIAWFTKSKVVCVGALSNGLHFPSIDRETGDVLKYADTVKRIIDILPEDVKIVPGHGEDCTMADYRMFHAMLTETADIVREGLDEGKDLATLQSEDILNDWTSFECSYVDKNRWIKYFVDAFQRKDSAAEFKQPIYEPIYYALKDGGVDAAVKLYYVMKADHYDEYRFDQAGLWVVAYKLFDNGKINEAIRFLELSVGEYPQGKYSWLCYHYLGEAYLKMGDKALAAENYRKSLELNPDNSDAAERLKELKQ